MDILGFIIERLWNGCSSKRAEIKYFNSLKSQTIEEIIYNCSRGVGSSECHFKLNSHQELIKSSMLNDDSKLLLNETINAALLCNSYGGKRSLPIPSGRVKTMSSDLKAKLMQS